MPAADIEYTYASIERAEELLDYAPQVTVEQGVEAFWSWYRQAVMESGDDGPL
jgi:nucleoside-diphosphate-sugar epimerase